MDWQGRMTRAIDYLEAHLCAAADFEAAAREANCSAFHFYRMFEIVAGIGSGEYLRFGYNSPDAFSRAFRREFGCLPSDARKGRARLHSYPRLFFSVVLKGDVPMEYRIEKSPAMKLAGISIQATSKDGNNFVDVPAFWDAVMTDGRWKALCAAADFKRLGVCGVCRDFDMQSGTFVYSIAVDEPAKAALLPSGSEAFEIPASTWGKFTSRGPLKPNFQDTIKRIFGEWLPASDWEHAGSAELEFYPETGGSPDSSDFWCEFWIPLKK